MSGGVDRTHGASRAERLTFLGLHVASLLACAVLLFGGGVEQLGQLLGRPWVVRDRLRCGLMLGVVALTCARHGLTLFYLLQRRVAWSEAVPLGLFILLFETGACLLTAQVAPPMDALAWTAVGLVGLGSLLNSGSELQRRWWKARPENAGRCYTGGLFRLATHINYTGEVVLFTGWCLLTGAGWTLALPALMLALFVTVHIPPLDRHLEARYGDAFRAYAARTAKLLPWIY